MDQQKKHHNKNRHVKWDEEKLQQTQQYRGKFQKINEPKTPYHGNSEEQEEEMEVQNKTEEQKLIDQSLKQAQKNRENNRMNKVDLAALNAQLKEQISKYKETGNEQMQQQLQTQQQRKKKQQFKKKRAAHYNQFKKIQEARNQKWEEDDD